MRLILAFLMLAAAAAPPVAAQEPGPHSRAEAVEIVRQMRRIVAPEGVERLEAVSIGGIDQGDNGVRFTLDNGVDNGVRFTFAKVEGTHRQGAHAGGTGSRGEQG
jgi:hypothetical protein